MVFLYWECYTFGLRFVTVLLYTKHTGTLLTGMVVLDITLMQNGLRLAHYLLP